MKDKSLGMNSPEITNFLQKNAHFSIESFNFFDKEALQKLNWGEQKKISKSKALVQSKILASLKAHQRLKKLHNHGAITQALVELGYDSAHKIAAVSKDKFLKDFTKAFPDQKEDAQKIYIRANNIKAQVQHLWANVHSVVKSRHARSMKVNQIDTDVADFFEGLPTYEDLFGTLDYCECEHCKSIFGPAAYFVDIMRVTQRYLTEPNQHTIKEGFALKDRRPGLFELELNCENTNGVIPYLQIVNEVLENRAAIELAISKGKTRVVTDNTAQLAADASGIVPGMLIFITTGTGQDQKRKITAFDTATQTVTVGENWTTKPDTNSAYRVTGDVFKILNSLPYPFNLPNNIFLETIRDYLAHFDLSLAEIYTIFQALTDEGKVVALNGLKITLSNSASVESEVYNNMQVSIVSGPGAGQWRTITAYDGATRIASIDSAWTTNPDTTSTYKITGQPTIARENLGISLESLHLLTTSNVFDPVLKERYGLQPAQGLDLLNDLKIFLFQTNLDRPEVDQLLTQNLSTQELTAGIAHQFYFNQPLADKQYVHLKASKEGATKLENLNAATLDRINRFVRLASQAKLTFEELDWAMTSLLSENIDASLIEQLSTIQNIRSMDTFPFFGLCSYWHDIKTIGQGTNEESEALFDQIFNTTSILNGRPSYHPLYEQNLLYKDPIINWVVDPKSTNDETFGRNRLLAALRLHDNELTGIAEALFDKNATVPLTVQNLSMLYRTSNILKVMGLPLEQYIKLLGFLEMDGPGFISPDNLFKLLITSSWLSKTRFSIEDLDFILNGERSKKTAYPKIEEDTPNFMVSTWTLGLNSLITPIAFAFNTITAELSGKIFNKLIAKSLLFSEKEAYERQLDLVPDSDVAIVLETAICTNLDFLKTDLNLSNEQVAYVKKTLETMYNGQSLFLSDQLSGFFNIEAGIGEGLEYYFSRILGRDDFLKQLFTPIKFSDPTKITLIQLFKNFTQKILLWNQIQLRKTGIISLADFPSAYNVTSLDKLTFQTIQNLVRFKDLLTAFGDDETEFVAYLAMGSDTDCSNGKKSAALSKLTGWEQPEICDIVKFYGAGSELYDTVNGIYRMKQGFDTALSIGVGVYYFKSLLFLRNLPAYGTTGKGTNWAYYATTSQQLTDIVKSGFSETRWLEVNKAIQEKVNGKKRNLLAPVVRWKVHEKEPAIENNRQLYEFLLIDIEMGGCSEISYIKEGLNAVQLYMQRCRLSLEPGVTEINIPKVWWQWIMNYRIWEGNRKIFLYPENYLESSLRNDRTDLFKKLEDELLQGEITKESVEIAYQEYLDGFAELAKLKYVDGYRTTVKDPKKKAVDSLFLFSRTEQEPYNYYYTVQEGGLLWKEWKKIDLTINSSSITPIYAFNKLFIFWVENTKISNSKIKNTSGSGSVSESSHVWKASIKYSFYNFTGNWVAPQTLVEEQILNVLPDDYHKYFNLESGYQLFNMDSVFWDKVTAQVITKNNYVGIPRHTSLAEKISILFGPMLENNVSGNALNPAPQPSYIEAQADPVKYTFDLEVYNAVEKVNQAVATRTRGQIPLRSALTLNQTLEKDFLMNSNEYFILEQNRSVGNPPSFRPEINTMESILNIRPSDNVLAENYITDNTSNINSLRSPQKVTESSFVFDGINDAGSKSVFGDLQTTGILDAQNFVDPFFTTNTNLSFLFSGAPEDQKELLIFQIRQALLQLKVHEQAANDQSFIIPAISATSSSEVYYKLELLLIVDNEGMVERGFSSRTNLSDLFSGAPPHEKERLIYFVRNVLFYYAGDPVIFQSITKDNSNLRVIKNQPGWFIFNNGDESFLLEADHTDFPLISALTQVDDELSQPRVTDKSFITPNISEERSKIVYGDLIGNYIINDDGLLDKYFNPRTNLNFLFPGESELKKSILIGEVRNILLILPSITTLKYFYENQNVVIREDSFISTGIDAQSSKEVFEDLKTNYVVDTNGIINKQFNEDTDLSYLFPNNKDSQTRQLLIDEVRKILFLYYEGAWILSVHDLRFKVTRISTGAVQNLSRNLFTGGIDKLLELKSQQIPVTPQLPFDRLDPSRNIFPPELPDGSQVDFTGPYGLYYWELFFYAPYLIAQSLSANQKFEEAQRWWQYIFNPTTQFDPITSASFETQSIDQGGSINTYDLLLFNNIIDFEGAVSKTFDSKTNLDFLFPNVTDEFLRKLMITEVRNVLLNHQLFNPIGRFWQFEPFRNHTLQSLTQILTNPAQITAYNNDPFSPYAIARLRIGAFEKGVVMRYIDNLIDWGDQNFNQFTWESLTTATMLYIYAYNLLGERPQNLGKCNTQPVATFEQILERYQDLPGGIPEFLIDMENLLGNANDISSLEINTSNQPFNDIESYFCVPENTDLLAYWDTIEDRLFKIRHCLNLKGEKQSLALFQPPINPLLLAQAAAAGGNVLDVLSQLQPAIPFFRFDYMLRQAKSVTSTLIQLGNSLLVALEKKDGEELSLMRTRYETQVLNLQTSVHQMQIDTAAKNIEAMQQTQSSVTAKAAYFSSLLDNGLSSYEQTNLDAMSVGLGFNLAASILRTASAIGFAMPQVGSPFAMTYGGVQVGSMVQAAAGVLEVGGQISAYIAQRSLTMGGYERRKTDWEFQLAQSESELAQINFQVESSKIQLAIAQQEFKVHSRNLENNQETETYLKVKFTNKDLYSWMADRVSTLYFQTYKLALDISLQAQRAYQYELNRNDNFISFSYWDSLKKGLLAGDGLMLSLNQLEKAHTDYDERRLEIQKTVSLLQLTPEEFIKLKETGECSFDLSEELFDYDYPGQYLRQIKSISLSIPAIIGPYQNIHATLTQNSNALVLKPELEAITYLIDTPTGPNPPASIRLNWWSNQQIAISSGVDDSGMFQLNFNDERYLPFEGTGAVSKWTLSMPHKTNRLNFEQLSDVIIKVNYTAKSGDTNFREHVEAILAGKGYQGGKYFNLKQTFSSAWFKFMTPPIENPSSQKLDFKIAGGFIFPNLKAVTLNSVYLRLDVPEDLGLPADWNDVISLKIKDGTAQCIPFKKEIGILEDLNLEEAAFLGAWELTVDIAKMKANPQLVKLLENGEKLDPEKFRDFEIILLYTARVF